MEQNKVIKVIQLSMATAFMLFFLAVLGLFNLTFFEKVIVAAGLLFVYAFFLILIRNFLKVKIVERIVIKEIEKPVIKEIIKKVIVQAKVAKKKPKKVIPMTKYIGSTETKTYHLRSCRFSKLIKPKFAIKEDTRAYYNKNKFKACKMCKPSKK